MTGKSFSYVKCTGCGNIIRTNKTDECQCGFHFDDGSVCGERVKIKDNLVKI